MDEIKVGDYVAVIDGDYKGLVGDVLAIYEKNGKKHYCIDSTQFTRDDSVVAEKVVKYPENVRNKWIEYCEARDKSIFIHNEYLALNKIFLTKIEGSTK